MAKQLQLLRNSQLFGSKQEAVLGLSEKLKTLSAGSPAIASYTVEEGKSEILLGIALDETNYQIFEGVKVTEGGDIEISQEIKDAIQDAIDGILGGASGDYNTLLKIENFIKSLQGELDKTQEGAGLEADGSYLSETGSNYIDEAKSLKEADKKLDDAIKAVNDKITKVAAGDGINVNNSENTDTISIKLNTSDKVLTVSPDGLLTNISLKYIKRVTEGEPSPAKLQLIGKNEEVITDLDVNDFVMDGMLSNAELQGDELVLTFNTDSGKEVIRVNLSKYIDVYTAGNGIDVSGKVISVKRDESSEAFLSVAEGGVKLSGVQDAINAAKGTIDAYTVNGKAISTNPVINGSEIKLDGYTRSESSNEDLNIAPSDTVNVAFGKLEKAILDNEEVCSKAFDAVATAVGLNREGMTYVAPEGSNYLTGAISVKDADSKLDAAIKAVSDKIDNEVSKDCLVEVEAGNGIEVTEKSASKQSISVKVKNLDPILTVNSDGIQTKEDASWDCGTYE